MASNVVELKRYESIVELIQNGRAIEDIFLAGIVAPDKPVASRLVAERAHMFVKNGNYRAGTSIRIRDLVEEGEIPVNQASSSGASKAPVVAAPVPPVQQTRNTYVPFKCPILNFCGKRMEGVVSGDAMILTKKEEK